MDRTNLKSLVETAPDRILVYSESLRWYLAFKMGREVSLDEMHLALHDAGRVIWYDFESLVETIR